MFKAGSYWEDSIFFGGNTLQPFRESLKHTLGISVEAFSEHYLGLPTSVGGITSGTFHHINERSHSKMQGWSSKNLACEAREVLTKSIIHVSPTYKYECIN